MPPRPYSPPPQEFGGEVSGSLDCPRHRESLAQPVPLRVRILPSTAKLYQPASEGRLYRRFTDPKDGWHDPRPRLGRPRGGSVLGGLGEAPRGEKLANLPDGVAEEASEKSVAPAPAATNKKQVTDVNHHTH